MTLKDATLSRTTASEEACLQRLLSSVELGDRTPSQLPRHMRSLVGTFTVDDAVLHSLWIKCLPNNTKLVLSTYDAESPLEKLAKTADKIHESLFAQTVSAVHTPDRDKPHPVDDSDDLRQQIAALNLKVGSAVQSAVSDRVHGPPPVPVPVPDPVLQNHSPLITPKCATIIATLAMMPKNVPFHAHTQRPLLTTPHREIAWPVSNTATAVADHSNCRLFTIFDNSTGLRFLIDTGAEVSVIPVGSKKHYLRRSQLYSPGG